MIKKLRDLINAGLDWWIIAIAVASNGGPHTPTGKKAIEAATKRLTDALK